MKQCLRTLVLLIRRTVFTVKRRASTPLFAYMVMSVCVCSFEHNFPLLRLMRRLSTSCINCETWQCAIFFTKRRFSVLFWLTRTSPGANIHIGGRVCMQLFTYEIMSDIIGLTHAKDCDVYSLWQTFLCATFWLIWTCPHANFLMRGRVCIQLVPQFHMFGLDRHVSTQCVDYKTCSCTCSHTKRPVSAHFLSHEVISMRLKHRKLLDKLYTDTSSHEKICMRTRPYKSKSCAEGRFFSQWIHITVLRVSQKMISDMISYVKSCIHTRCPM